MVAGGSHPHPCLWPWGGDLDLAVTLSQESIPGPMAALRSGSSLGSPRHIQTPCPHVPSDLLTLNDKVFISPSTFSFEKLQTYVNGRMNPGEPFA